MKVVGPCYKEKVLANKLLVDIYIKHLFNQGLNILFVYISLSSCLFSKGEQTFTLNSILFNQRHTMYSIVTCFLSFINVKIMVISIYV